MSGNVVGWVYENYPVRCAADRTRKIILAEVAEAANRDFENAHPGVRRICSDWHLGRSTVIASLGELVADGWLEITENARGHNATVYRVCRERSSRWTSGEAGEVQPLDPRGPGISAQGSRDSAQGSRDSVCSPYPSSVSTQEPPERPPRGEKLDQAGPVDPPLLDALLQACDLPPRKDLGLQERSNVERAYRLLRGTDHTADDVRQARLRWRGDPPTPMYFARNIDAVLARPVPKPPPEQDYERMNAWMDDPMWRHSGNPHPKDVVLTYGES